MLGYGNGCFILPSSFFCITAQFSKYKSFDGLADYLCISTFLEWRGLFIQIAIFWGKSLLVWFFWSLVGKPFWTIFVLLIFLPHEKWPILKRQNMPFASPFQMLSEIEDQSGNQRTTYQKLWLLSEALGLYQCYKVEIRFEFWVFSQLNNWSKPSFSLQSLNLRV